MKRLSLAMFGLVLMALAAVYLLMKNFAETLEKSEFAWDSEFEE